MMRAAALFLLIPIWVGVLPLAAQVQTQTEGNPPLKYQFKSGASLLYSVRIEADEELYTDMLLGSVNFVVRALEHDSATLTTRSTLMAQRRPKDPRNPQTQAPFRLGRFWSDFLQSGGPSSGSGEIKIDAQGQLLKASGERTLPWAMGDLAFLVLEPMSSKDHAWQSSAECRLVVDEHFPNRPPPGFNRAARAIYPAQELSVFGITGVSNHWVQIQKTYELKTRETVTGAPRFQVDGKGFLVFDTQAGVPRSFEFKGTLTDHTTNVTRRTPLSVTYRLLEGSERDPVTLAATPPGVAKTERRALPANDFNQLLFELNSSQAYRRRTASDQLPRFAPGERRAEIAKALEPLLEEEDTFARTSAARALGVWGGPDQVPALVRRLDDEAISTRMAVIDALASLRDARGAEALARRMAADQDAPLCRRALEQMGSVAEPALIGLLKEKLAKTRREACVTLKSMGTRECVAALTESTTDPDSLVALSAKDALRTITARINPAVLAPKK